MDLQHIQRYTRPRDFADFGDIPRNEYYVAYGQHRDSDCLTRSNFRSILKALDGESETVLVIRDSHWAVGWVEAIYIHESDEQRLEVADHLLAKLADYPVVDEDDWSELEYEVASSYWASMTVTERVQWLQRYEASVSIFAARRAELPAGLNDIAALAE